MVLRQNWLYIKSVTRDQNDHDIMIKVSIHQEDIKIINIYAQFGALNDRKQVLIDLKG